MFPQARILAPTLRIPGSNTTVPASKDARSVGNRVVFKVVWWHFVTGFFLG
uniref:Uncharacterized protein n=1 Tax=Rhizophora mucronata TaxID=61149 RepID=A0A2P2NYB8_RHIMU